MIIINTKLLNIALQAPKILLPDDSVDMEKWAVIACDQYTSEPDYWKDVEKFVGSSPSSLKLFLPEAYLDTPREKKSKNAILREMKSYLRSGVLNELEPGFIYVRRTTAYGNVRNGFMACVALEMCSFESGSSSMIRPTEKTIIERIPPRVKIREKAALELPHILFLIDDPGKTVVEPLDKTRNLYQKIYDFKLMKNGGRIEGYHINETHALASIANAITELADIDAFAAKYGNDKDLLLYAVGDGNHSLASAKQHWENLKSSLTSEDIKNHPARFALVEIINIHDEGMKFEPIHRVLFDCPVENLIEEMKTYFDISIKDFADALSLGKFVEKEYDNKESHTFGLVSEGKYLSVTVNSPKFNLAVATIQTFLDDFLENNNIEIDFIHDADSMLALAKPGNTGLLLPPIDKSGFFKTIIDEGTLPRKAFSMGHADEKRFYLEARRIVK